MSALLLNILLALAWVAMTGQFTPINLVIGFGLGLIALWLTRRDGEHLGYIRKISVALSFALYFVWELVLANLRMAYLLLKPHHALRPAIVAVPLDVKTDLEITLLATLVTLTPGTLALDVSDDHRMLYIHAADVRDIDRLRSEIKQGFERRIKELFA